MAYTDISVSGYELAAVNGMSDPDPLGFGWGVRYAGGKLSFVLLLAGHKWRVTIPVELVHEEMDRTFAEQGLDEPAEIGETASCNGLFRRVKRAFRRKGLLKRIGKHALLGPAAFVVGDTDVDEDFEEDEQPEVGRRRRHKRRGLFGKLAKHALLGPAAFVVGDDSEFAEVGRRHRRRGGLFRAIKRIGKRVLKTVKKVVQSKALGVLVAASAMVMPAIGGPALAALTTAKVAMKVAEAARRGGPIANAKTALMRGNLRQLARSSAPMARLAVSAFRTQQR